MENGESRAVRIAAACAALACLFQIVGLVRYLGRLPGDWVGIGLCAVTIVALALGALGLTIQGRS